MTHPQSPQQPLHPYEFLTLYPDSYPRLTTEENEQTPGAQISPENTPVNMVVPQLQRQVANAYLFERVGTEDIADTEGAGVEKEARA